MKILLLLLLLLIYTLLIDHSLFASPLNDTGIRICGNETSNNLSCPQLNFSGQDAESGRDITHNNDSDGIASFSYTKIDNNGNDLDASALVWFCVRDNKTGLIWEVKTDDGGLRDKDWRYSWYNSNTSTNGGNAGSENNGNCDNLSDCDTEKYVFRVNNNVSPLCGYTDWRVPEITELLNFRILVHAPSLDRNYFPFLDWIEFGYWSATTYAYSINEAWRIKFLDGSTDRNSKSNQALRTVLVRDGL